MNSVTTRIAGIFKYPDAKPVMKAAGEGYEFAFKREPENQYDPNAIALFVVDVLQNSKDGVFEPQQVKCGYIPKDIAASLVDVEISTIKKGKTFDEIIIEF